MKILFSNLKEKLWNLYVSFRRWRYFTFINPDYYRQMPNYKYKEVSFEKWAKRYKIINIDGGDVESGTPEEYVWSMNQSEDADCYYITNGYTHVNNVDFYVGRIPWNRFKTVYYVKLDEWR